MEKTLERFAAKMMPIADAIGNQRHMQAIRNGLIAILPLTIVGSFFVILLNLPFPGYAEMIAPYRDAIDVPFRFTVGIMGLYSAFTIGSYLGASYHLNQITSGFLAVMATLMMVVPVNLAEGISATGNAIAGGRYIPVSALSSQGLFGAMIASLIAVEIYQFMLKKDIQIKMPDGVPPVVAQSFAALFPTAVIIIVFWIPRHFFGFDLNGLITVLISPLKSFLTGNNLLGGILTQLLICIFWLFGIHGHAALGPIIRPFWDQAITQNMELFQSGTPASELPNVFTEQFFQWYAQMGGTGATLALVVLFLFSKSKYLKSLGQLSILPGIFNINEPMIFGAPIVMNPILGVPFILAPIANTIVIYMFTRLNFMPRMMVKPPFSVPAPLGALMSTNWSWFAAFATILSFFLSLAIYYPFFKIFEKRNLETEQAEIQAKATQA